MPWYHNRGYHWELYTPFERQQARQNRIIISLVIFFCTLIIVLLVGEAAALGYIIFTLLIPQRRDGFAFQILGNAFGTVFEAANHLPR